MFDVIAFDADDTLWHNETLYSDSQTRFKQLLSGYASPEEVDQALYQTEMRNLEYFGYGIKSFTLSMIETAIEMSRGHIQTGDIQKIIGFAREMLRAEVQVLEHVEETLVTLSESYDLMVITKGDLFDQEAKLARSGIMKYFRHIEIVSDKTEESYASLLRRHQILPSRFLMVGNSLRSDILPVVALGGRAIHIPYHLTWVHETASEQQVAENAYFVLEHIGLLPELVQKLTQGD